MLAHFQSRGSFPLYRDILNNFESGSEITEAASRSKRADKPSLFTSRVRKSSPTLALEHMRSSISEPEPCKWASSSTSVAGSGRVNTDAKNLQNNSALSLPVEAVTPRSDHFIVTGIDLLFVLDFIKEQKRLGFLSVSVSVSLLFKR